MRSRVVRVTLAVLATGAIAAAAYVSWTIHSHTAGETLAAVAFDRAHAAALKEAFELRSAQQAYVASGQNEAFWFERVTVATASLGAALDGLKSATTSQDALASLKEAGAAIEDFEQIDRRARHYVAEGQRLLASDVIFSDGLEAAGRIIAALEGSAASDQASRRSVAAEAERQQTLMTGGAAAVAILALLLLTPLATPPSAVVQDRNLEAMPTAEPRRTMDVELGALLDAHIAEPPRPAPSPREPQVAADAPLPDSAAEIQRLAAVCMDLARLSDANLLPEILERAGAALDASGLVVWIADPDGKELLPIAAHGYPASVLARMGSLKAEDENATAAAFRTGLLQTVSATAGSTGAIAVPLVTPSGCRGVMSAEVHHESEKQSARLAAASIVGAQLATLVGAPAAQTQERSSAL
jgi:hypothetical protein